MLHKFGLQKRQQHVSAAKHDRPNFQKRQKQSSQSHRPRARHHHRRQRAANHLRSRHRPHPQQPRPHPQLRRRQRSRNNQHPHRAHSNQIQPHRQRRNHRQRNRLDPRAPQFPQRLNNDRHHHRLDRPQHALRLGQRAIAHIRPRNRHRNQRRRNNKAAPRHDQPAPPALQVPDKNRHFRRTRPRNQIRRRQPIQKVGLRNPFLPSHEFFLHHRQVRRRPAKRNRPQLQKHKRNLAQRSLANFPRFHAERS